MGVTQKRIAKLLGLSERQIRNLVREGMPTNSLTSANLWYHQHVACKTKAKDSWEYVGRRLQVYLPDIVDVILDRAARHCPNETDRDHLACSIIGFLFDCLRDVGLSDHLQTPAQLGVDDLLDRSFDFTNTEEEDERAEAFWLARGEPEKHVNIAGE